MSRKNIWRTRGQLQFQRKTCRYYDGTPKGEDVLYVRIRGAACVYCYSGEMVINDHVYKPGHIWGSEALSAPPIRMAKQLRRALHVKANRSSIEDRFDYRSRVGNV